MRRSGPGRAGLKPTAHSPKTAAAGGIKKVQILYSLDFITKKILPCPLPSCRLSILKATLTPTPPGDGCGGGGFSLLNKRVPAPPSKSAGFCLIRARILKTGSLKLPVTKWAGYYLTGSGLNNNKFFNFLNNKRID